MHYTNFSKDRFHSRLAGTHWVHVQMQISNLRPSSLTGNRVGAVTEEAAYQTGLDTRRLVCLPGVRHVTNNMT